MSDTDHRALFDRFTSIVDAKAWARLGEVLDDESVWEFPQSGEVFRGLSNIRASFEEYPDLGTGSSELQEVIGGTEYALAPNFTLVTVQGSGQRGAAIIRARYPDGSRWYVINLYEIRAGKLGHVRVFFAPEFEAPEWRAPFRESTSPG